MANIEIGGRLHSTATGNVVTGANEVLDDIQDKKQQEINAELIEAVGTGGSVDSRIAAAVENAAFLGANDGSAVIADFDPQSDTVHVTAQTLSESQKAQVRTNIGLGDVDAKINEAVASEASRAEAAEEALDGRVDTLEDAVGSGGSVNSRIAAAKAEIKGNATSACDTLGEAEAKINANTTAISNEATARANAVSAEASRARAAEQLLQEQYNALTQSDIIIGALPASGTKNKIYRVPGTNTYSDYMWNGSSFVKMATYDNAIDNEPTAGSNNLVKSGGVYPCYLEVIGETGAQKDISWASGGWKVIGYELTGIPKGANIICDSASSEVTVIFGEYNSGAVGQMVTVNNFKTGSVFVAPFDIYFIYYSDSNLNITLHYEYESLSEKVDNIETQINGDGGIIENLSELSENQDNIDTEINGVVAEQKEITLTQQTWKIIGYKIPKDAKVICDYSSVDGAKVLFGHVEGSTVTKYYTIDNFYSGIEFFAPFDLDVIYTYAGSQTLILHYEVDGLVKKAAPAKLSLITEYQANAVEIFEIFFNGIFDGLNPENYDFKVKFSDNVVRGKNFRDKWQWTPSVSDVGAYDAIVELYSSNGLVDSKEITINVNNPSDLTSNSKVCLIIGDSLTYIDGNLAGEVYRRICSNDAETVEDNVRFPAGYGKSNFNFIGVVQSVREPNAWSVGVGGWTADYYNKESKRADWQWITCTHDKTSSDIHSVYKDSQNRKWRIEDVETGRIKLYMIEGAYEVSFLAGTLTWVSGGTNRSDISITSAAWASGNPFWIGGKVDFAAFAQQQNVSTIDYIVIELGTNNVGSTNATIISDTKTLIDNILSDFPNCKICLMTTHKSAREGWNDSSWTYYDWIKHCCRLKVLYEEIAKDYPNNIKVADMAAELDTEHCTSTSYVDYNSRYRGTDYRRIYRNNALHPTLAGYCMMADTIVRDMVARLQ